MLKFNRYFRSIMFNIEGIDDIDKLSKLLPYNSISKRPKVDISDIPSFEDIKIKNIQIEHFYYHSPKLFSLSPILANLNYIDNGITIYQYNLYLIKIITKDELYFVVSAPFSEMLKDIISYINESLGKMRMNLAHKRIDLDELFYKIEINRNMGGQIKIKRFESIITGESKIKTFSLSGSDALHSMIWDYFPIEKESDKIFKDLFTLDLSYKIHLNSKDLVALQDIFARNEYLVTEKALINLISEKEWEIVDEEGEIIYHLEESKNELKVGFRKIDRKVIKGLKYILRNCSLSFNNHIGNKIILKMDKNGLFSYWASENTKSLISLCFIMEYMKDENLIRDANVVFPLTTQNNERG